MRSRLTVTLAALLTVALAGCTQGGKPAESNKSGGGTVELTGTTGSTFTGAPVAERVLLPMAG